MLSPVSLTPAINCSPVSTTRPITTEVCAFCKSNSGRRSQPRPPILSLEQPRKGAKAPHMPWNTWGRQNYCKPKRHYLVLAALGASDQDVWGVYGCNFSWQFQWHNSAALADFGGRRYRRFIPFNFLPSLAAPHLHGVLVFVTGDKFIAGVVVTADNWSPVSTININDTGDHWKSVTRTNRRCQRHRQ